MTSNVSNVRIALQLTKSMTKLGVALFSFVFALLKPKFCPLPPLPPLPPHLVLPHDDDDDDDHNDDSQPPYISTHTPPWPYIVIVDQPSQPTQPHNPNPTPTTSPLALDDSDQMPGLHWPFVLAPLPPRRKKPVQPGFTAEELLYLEEVLAVVRPLPSPTPIPLLTSVIH